MGLPGVLRPLIKYLRVRDKSVGFKFHKLDAKVDEFYADFNQFFYLAYNMAAGIHPENQVLEEQFTKQMTKQMREEMVIKQTLVMFENVLDKFEIAKTIYIAVDGVAPAAKMNQQRMRRWKSAYKIKKEVEKKFDTNAFTPGTGFMKKFHEEMVKWIETNGVYHAPTIIYDSYRTVGEGEHKIMKYLRIKKPEGKKVLYGMDADLLMLSLLSPAQDMFLVREDIQNDDQVLDVDKIRAALVSLHEHKGAEQIIEDFTLLMTIFGSDFFPRIPSLSDSEKVMEMLMGAWTAGEYKPISKKDGSFNVRALMDVFAQISEEELLQEKATKEFIFPDHFLNKASTLETVEDQLGNRRVYVKEFNYNKYRNLWYANALRTTEKVNPLVSLTNEQGERKDPMEVSRMITDLVKEYLIGIAWYHRYYTKGMDTVSQVWAFSYTYPPLLKDLVKTRFTYDDLSIHYRDKTPVNPVVQLLVVLPPRSSSLITSVNIRKFMKDEDLEAYYTEQFEYQLMGTNDEWRSVPIIAPANVKLVEGVIQKRVDDKAFPKGSLHAATIPFSPIKPIQYATGRTGTERKVKPVEEEDHSRQQGGRGGGNQGRRGGRGGNQGGGRGGNQSQGGGRGGNQSQGGRGGARGRKQGFLKKPNLDV